MLHPEMVPVRGQSHSTPPQPPTGVVPPMRSPPLPAPRCLRAALAGQSVKSVATPPVNGPQCITLLPVTRTQAVASCRAAARLGALRIGRQWQGRGCSRRFHIHFHLPLSGQPPQRLRPQCAGSTADCRYILRLPMPWSQHPLLAANRRVWPCYCCGAVPGHSVLTPLELRYD